MLDCNINEANIFRLIVTLLVFYKLKHNNNKFIQKNILLFIALLLVLIDTTDSFFIKKIYKNNTKCTKTFDYQISDKILDSVSYIFLLFILPENNILKFFILFRLLGVIMFYFTKNSQWLIFFFDFIKEYLVYLFIFGDNHVILFLFVLIKILFEFYCHTFHNKNNYKTTI